MPARCSRSWPSASPVSAPSLGPLRLSSKVPAWIRCWYSEMRRQERSKLRLTSRSLVDESRSVDLWTLITPYIHPHISCASIKPYTHLRFSCTAAKLGREPLSWKSQSILQLCCQSLIFAILAIHRLHSVCVSTIVSLFNDHSTALYTGHMFQGPKSLPPPLRDRRAERVYSSKQGNPCRSLPQVNANTP
jgi:hypothetical protein